MLSEYHLGRTGGESVNRWASVISMPKKYNIEFKRSNLKAKSPSAVCLKTRSQHPFVCMTMQ